MNENRQQQLAERQWQHAFEEISGRVVAPDRVEQILRRTASRDAAAGAPTAAASGMSRMLAAALLLMGVVVTVLAAVERSRRIDEATNGGQPEPAHTWVSAAASPPAGPSAEPQAGEKQPQEAKPDPGQEPKTGQKPEAAKQSGKQLPKGSDPADLAAMRSAEAMLAAEKKLAQLIEAGKIGGVDRVLPFGELDNWTYTDGLRGMPQRVRRLDGMKVLMLGFMLPIDDVENMREFLLVSSLWSCCYGTPPDIHGIVRCRMPVGKVVDYQFEPLKIVGTFNVEETVQDGYCIDIYQLHVDFLEVIQ